MRQNYVKPEIIEEVKLERKLVYAKVYSEEDGCTTTVSSIDQDTKLS